jgi:salicylate hydroxylase
VTADRVLIAGAGIGGLAAGLALARRGIAVTLFEQAERLEETGAGAGIQLAPNATGLLIALGLAERLKPAIVAPAAIRLRAARSGRDIAVMPLAGIAARLGAPYWVIHRADLQAALREAAAGEPRIALMLGARVDGFTIEADGVRASVRRGETAGEYAGSVLIGADGLWSSLRARLGDPAPPRFANRTAWRAMLPAAGLPPHLREPEVTLWLGAGGHLVHYPIRGGSAVNIVAVARDAPAGAGGGWQSQSWNTSAARDEVLARFPATCWAADAGALLAAPERWQKWALYDRPPSARSAPSRHLGRGPVTLLGDAAHPMLPFLAQGAAMAIEDGAVLAAGLAHTPGDPQRALRAYEAVRRQRTARLQGGARRNDLLYHFGWPSGAIRDAVLRLIGGERLLARYDWIFGWRPPPPADPTQGQ